MVMPGVMQTLLCMCNIVPLMSQSYNCNVVLTEHALNQLLGMFKFYLSLNHACLANHQKCNKV